MMSKYIKKATGSFDIAWLDISKILLLIFLLYMNWYKELFGDVSIILYGSALLLTLSLVLPFGEEEKRHIDFTCMTGFYKVLLAYGIYCLISGVFVSINRSSFISSMITYFCYLIVLFDCCLISQRDGSWDWLFNIMFMVAAVCCFQTILFGKPMKNGGAIAYTMGPLNNTNALAHVMIFGIFGLVASKENGTKKLGLKTIFILLFCYTIILSGSRKGLISAVVFVVIWGYSLIRKFRRNPENSGGLLPAFLVIIAIAVVAIYFSKYYIVSDQYERLMRIFGIGEDSSNEDRIQMYQLAVNLWKQHPIFGVGFNQYKLYSWRGDYSHSTYAEILSCSGLIGSLILFAPILRYFVGTIKNFFYSDERYHYTFSICFAGILIELFLGIGQIWIYGISHELFLLCLLGFYETTVRNVEENKDIQLEVNGKCKYLL